MAAACSPLAMCPKKCELLTFNIKLCSFACNTQHQEENKYQIITNRCQVKIFNNVLNRIASQNTQYPTQMAIMDNPSLCSPCCWAPEGPWSCHTLFSHNPSGPLVPSGSLQEAQREPLLRGIHTCSVKGWREKVLGFVGYRVPITTTQLCSLKADRDNTQMNEHGCVPTKLYL